MLVFDVSSYNTGDLPPCDGIIARTSIKNRRLDRSFYEWVRYAHDNAKKFGAYKYIYATSRVKAEIEAEAVAKILRGINIPLGFWLDCEENVLRVGSDTLLSSIIEAYKEAMKYYDIQWGGIYCDYDFYIRHKSVLDKEVLWLARWTHNQDQRPSIFDEEHVRGWQYTNQYNKKKLDASIFKEGEQTQEKRVLYNPDNVRLLQEKRVLYNPDNVRLLQEYLNKHYGYSLKVDGVMGTKTFTAICQTIAK